MRVSVLLLSYLGLAGCGDPLVEGCEDFIKDQLKSPSSYKRLDVTTLEEPVNLAMFEATHGKGGNGVHRSIADTGDLSRRMVGIEYDASNSFGVPIRGGEVCEFHMMFEKPPSRDSIASSVSMAKRTRTLRQLGEAGALPNQPKLKFEKQKYPCCEN